MRKASRSVQLMIQQQRDHSILHVMAVIQMHVTPQETFSHVTTHYQKFTQHLVLHTPVSKFHSSIQVLQTVNQFKVFFFVLNGGELRVCHRATAISQSITKTEQTLRQQIQRVQVRLQIQDASVKMLHQAKVGRVQISLVLLVTVRT